MMRKLSISLPETTLASLDRKAAEYKRSQFISYAVLAMLARLDGRLVDAVGYEHAAKALCRG